MTHWANIYQDKYAVKRIQKAVSLLKYWPGCRVLDMGANTGELQKHLPDYVHYEGIDFRDGDFNIRIPAQAAWYNYIFCLEVLEHLHNPDRVMEYIKSHCQYAVISIPNENTLYHRIKALLGYGCDDRAFIGHKHLHLPTIKQARDYVKGFGAICKEVYYISPSMCGARAEWLGEIAKRLPDSLWQALADTWASLFARGVILLLQ